MLNELINEILEKREQALRAKIKRYPMDKFHASNIHECDRYMTYLILNWQDKTLHGTDLQARFDKGNLEEKYVISELTELGFSVILAQQPFDIKNRAGDVICRGRIDGKILYKGKVYPIEIKSIDPNNYQSINSIEDLEKHQWYKHYVHQMQLYLYGNCLEEGMFILTDLKGKIKFIPIKLDYEEVENIISRLEKIWENNIKPKVYPDPMQFKEDTCGKCPFRHICPVITQYAGVDMIDDPLLEKKLEKHAQLKPLVKEYDELDDEIKGQFKLYEKDVTVGSDWLIKINEYQRKCFDIPADIKKSYEHQETYKKINIVKLK